MRSPQAPTRMRARMSRSGHLRTRAEARWSRGSRGCREGDPVPLKGPQGGQQVNASKRKCKAPSRSWQGTIHLLTSFSGSATEVLLG